MQLTYNFVLAALIALKATSVAALPVASGDVASVDAREVVDYEQVAARGLFQKKIGSEQNTMNRESARIKAEEQRLHAQQKDVSLQEQIHKDRQALRSNNAFGRRKPAQVGTHGRFQSKISSEQLTMGREAARIKEQERRLQSQQKDVSLQEQIYKDRQALRNNNAFSRRELESEELVARGRFQNKIGSEQRTMGGEAARIKTEEQRLHAQHKDVSLQKQIHKDRQALRSNNAFGRRKPTQVGTHGRFQSKISSEQLTMGREAARIKEEERRLQAQQKDVSLQEQIYKDSQALRSNNAFGQ